MIGEHTDYTGGFVMPLALERGTVVYGVGRLVRELGTKPDRREKVLTRRKRTGGHFFVGDALLPVICFLLAVAFDAETPAALQSLAVGAMWCRFAASS